MKFIFIVLSLILTRNLVYSQDYCKFIENVENYQSKVKLNKCSDSIDNRTFNLDTYLSIFNLLQKESNLEYCYSYYNSELDGQPILYVKDEKFDLENYLEKMMTQSKEEIVRKSQTITLNQTNTFESIEKAKKMEVYISTNYRNGYSYEYMTSPNYAMKNHLIPEMTKIGYFQYLYFYQMGESFAGYWHSKEKYVICSNEAFDKIRKDYGIKITENVELTPIVSFVENKCKITWYECVEMEGIYKRTYEIHMEKPFDVNRTENKLVASEINEVIIY